MEIFIDIGEDLLHFAVEMARKIKARAIMISADIFTGRQEIEHYLQESSGQPVILITTDPAMTRELEDLEAEVIQVPAMPLSRQRQIKMAALLGLSRNKLQRGDRLVCLTGRPGRNMMDTLLFLEVGEEYEIFSARELEELGSHIIPEVFERVLDIAVSLGSEGREGRPVGTTFVIGDTENVLRHSIPLVLNPFRGYPEEERNILSSTLTETVKEFAAIDGAFVLRGDGLIEAAGVYLKPAAPGERLPWGLGARHHSAAGITASTQAVAVTVSESTGTVTVFREGRIFLEVERLRLKGRNRSRLEELQPA